LRKSKGPRASKSSGRIFFEENTMGEPDGSNGAPIVDANAPAPTEGGFLTSWFMASPCQNVDAGIAIPLGSDSKKMEIRLEEEAQPAPGVTVSGFDDPNFSMYPVAEDQVIPPPPAPHHPHGSESYSRQGESPRALSPLMGAPCVPIEKRPHLTVQVQDQDH